MLVVDFVDRLLVVDILGYFWVIVSICYNMLVCSDEGIFKDL